MAILTPLWMQGGSYPARYDRQLFTILFGSRERVGSGLVVSQHAAGDLSVDISVGWCVIQGDDQSNQGMYPFIVDAVYNQVMPAAPGSDKRIDLVCARINDPNAGGPAGSTGSFVIVQGTVSATPTAPAVPTSALALAQVLRTAGDGSVLTAMITDVAARGAYPINSGTASPSGIGVVGDLYVKYA